MIEYFMGIDPGLSGALSCIDSSSNVIFTHDMPVVEVEISGSTRRVIDLYALKDLMLRVKSDYSHSSIYVFSEQTSPLFKLPAQSNWSLGASDFAIRTAVAFLDLRFVLVRPKMWQKIYNIKTKEDSDTKSQSYQIAKRLFPKAELETKRGRVLDGRADSLLIAEYGRRSILYANNAVGSDSVCA